MGWGRDRGRGMLVPGVAGRGFGGGGEEIEVHSGLLLLLLLLGGPTGLVRRFWGWGLGEIPESSVGFLAEGLRVAEIVKPGKL